jgi:hypothetical protein
MSDSVQIEVLSAEIWYNDARSRFVWHIVFKDPQSQHPEKIRECVSSPHSYHDLDKTNTPDNNYVFDSQTKAMLHMTNFILKVGIHYGQLNL